MNHDNVFALKNPAVPNEARDALTEVLREGARTLLAQAIEAEVAQFLARHAEKRDAAGRARLAAVAETARRRDDREGHHRSQVQKRSRSAEEGSSKNRRLIKSPYITFDNISNPA